MLIAVSWPQIQPFLVALAIGLLLGFERERGHARELPAGSRSFALLSLVGAVAASMGSWAVVVGLATVGALLALAYNRTSKHDPGTTTEIAALAVYLASDESAFTTGTAQVIDGGWSN